MQIITGPSFNHLSRIPAGQITPSPVLDTVFNAAGLIDYNTEVPVSKYSAIQNPSSFVFDLSIMVNGDFESGSLNGWTTLTGSAAADNTQHNTGNWSAKLNASSSLGQTLTFRSGEAQNIPYALRGDGVTGIAAIQVLEVDTGLYLNSGGAWVAGPVNFDTQSAAAWKTGTIAVPVPPIGNALAPGTFTDLTSVQVIVLNTAAGGNAWADSMFAFPSTSFAGIFGHNVPPSVVVTLQSSPDNVTYTTQATLTNTKPTMWAALTGNQTTNPPWKPNPFATRFVKLNFAGTPASALWMAEIVLSQLYTPTPFPLAGGITYAPEVKQIRNVTPSGQQYVTPLSSVLRHPTITFPIYGVASLLSGQYQDLRDNVIERARLGAWQTIVLLPELDADFCLWGLVKAQYKTDVKMLSERQIQIMLEELPVANPLTSVAVQ